MKRGWRRALGASLLAVATWSVGGLSAAADLFLAAAEAEARARALPALAERTRISVARAGNDAGVIGAGLLAAQELALTGDTAGLTAREEVG